MRVSVSRRRFNRLDSSEILEFALMHPHHPCHGERTLRRFLADLTSSTEMVFDYHADGERKLVAMLVDNIQNPSNSANLEIIGYKNSEHATVLINQLVLDAKRSLSKLRDGIEIGINAKSVVTTQVLKATGFTNHYMTFEMWLDDLRSAAEIVTPTNLRWSKLTSAIFDAYYSVVKKAFAKNLEASIPPLEEMKRGFDESRFAVTLLLEDETIIGFISIQTEERDGRNVGEVHMIGLLPSVRNRGLGGVLLSRALIELQQLGADKVKLTVAAENENALKLYKKFGFVVRDQDTCLRWKRE